MIQSKRTFGKVDIDTDELKVDEQVARFVKNMTTSIKRNAVGDGANGKVSTPVQSNSLYTDGKIVFPSGFKQVCGFYEAKETNEGYVFVFSYEDDHFIYRINGVDGSCTMIYRGACLPFLLDPAHFISEGRCFLHNDTYIDLSDGTRKPRKLLAFTTNYKDQCCISVEDSAATNSFNIGDYPYFNSLNYNACELIRLGVPTPSQCITIENVERDENDQKQNLLSYKGWKFRIKTIDVFGRESEWGIISDEYFTIIGAGCISNSSGLSRCISLKLEAGGPLVDKILLAYSTCSGQSDLSVDSDWYLADTIIKYNNCDADKKWYERTIRNPYQVKYDQEIADGATADDAAAAAKGLLKYDSLTNTFAYTFCNDKECQLIAREETVRTENPLPFESSSLFPIDKGIGLANNRRGWSPLTCDLLEKFEFSVIPPAGSECESSKLRTIVVYANLWNPFLSDASLSRTKNGNPIWGLADCSQNNPLAYDMYFAPGQEGFLGYLSGTPYYAISQQVIHGIGQPDQFVGVHNLFGAAHLYLQKFEFKVPPGKYIFRIASHRATPSDEYQKTSTYVKHTSKWDAGGGAPIPDAQEIKELVINVCESDHLSDESDAEILTIWDLTRDGRGAKINLNNCWGNATTLVDGYAYEDEVSNLPIEYAEVEAEVNGGDKFNSWYTDHNGFFFAAAKRKNCRAKIKVLDCIDNDNAHETDLYSKEALDNFNSGGHKVHDVVYVKKGLEEFSSVGRRTIEGKIVLCGDDAVGLAGVLVCVTKGQPTFTDANGKFKLLLHNRTNLFAGSPSNKDTVIVSQKGSCKLVSCADPCDGCFADHVIDYIDCTTQPRKTTLGDIVADISGINRLGPQTGGRYGLCINLYDWMGRRSFAQADERFYVDIPSLRDTRVFKFSQIQWALDGTAVFPDNVAYFTIGITENLNQDDFLMWAVDKVEFVDSGGNVNNVAPTQIKIYYGSINEYNKQNNFATTTNWQFIDSNGSQEKSVVGDQIEFLINGDGKWFEKSIISIVRYDKDGKYITIDYSDDLSKLTAGGLIKLIRPKQCVSKYLYYEICPKITVNNAGVPSSFGGIVNYFDSYFLNRQLPIPEEVSTTVNNVVTKTTVIKTKSFDFSFEHPSPSDLWGSKCRNGGRINVKNPYERQQRFGNEIALSKAISENSSFNGLSYFDIDDISSFDKQEWGNITVVLPEVNLILVICEKDSFIAGYNESDLKVGDDGLLRATSTLGKFGRPQRKVGKNFGCQPQDINTIRKTDGVVLFLDRNKAALVIHGYGEAISINDVADSGFKTWVRNKLSYANNNNLTNAQKIIFHAGIDPKTKEYYLTSFLMPAKSTDPTSYNNTQEDWNYAVNETVCIDVNGGYLKAAVGFTPEYYGSLEGFYKSKNLFSFKNANGWIHHDNGSVYSACNFYGVQDKKVIKVIFNDNPEMVKRYLYNEVYCKEHRFVIKAILTEAGQTSRLLAVHWKKGERFWAADFKCALNTAFNPGLPANITGNPLFNGDILSGRWLMATYISEGADHAKYCEVSAIKACMLEVPISG